MFSILKYQRIPHKEKYTVSYFCYFYCNPELYTGRGFILSGCDSGFGNHLARRLDEKGFTVFAGCLIPNREGAQQLKEQSSSRLHIVHVDVTDEWLVRGAVKYVKENLGDNGNV